MMTRRTMRGYVRAFLIVFAAVLSGTVELHAAGTTDIWRLYQEGEASFRQANELFPSNPEKARDHLEKAALAFEAIYREGAVENGMLFYNIGNIYFRLGDTGRAILNYRRAERFIPNDVNLQQNLNYARSRRIDRIEPTPQSQVFRTLFFWHYDLGVSIRAWLFAAAFGLLWLLTAIHLFKRKTWLRNGALVCAVLSISLASSLAMEAYSQSHTRSGVLLDKEVIARKGDSTTFEPTFKDPLHAGVEFKLVEERKGWFHIELADGRRCWIPDSSAELI